MKVSELANQFKRYALYERGVTPKYYGSIVATLCKLIDHAGTETITNLDENLIKEFLYDMQERRMWSPKTFREYRQHLVSYFEWCVRNQFIRKNPAKKIEKPKLPKRLPRCLTRKEAFTIVSYTASYQWATSLERIRNEAIIMTLLFTGIRLQELLNLTIHDVNLEEETIFINQGKGHKDRIVPIHRRLMPILLNYCRTPQKKLQQSILFFTSLRSGQKLNPPDVRRICSKVSNKSNIKFTPHMLRHTFGRLSTEADLNPYKLKELMGHSSINTTQIYQSVSTENLKSSFNKIHLI